MVQSASTMSSVHAKAVARQKIARLAFWSIVVALVVLALKFAAWYITGSVALYSDALESIVNVIASAAALWAIQVSYKPADQDHPFGHHKAEYFSAVLEGVLIVVAALLILNEVWSSWQAKAPLEQPWTGLAINGVATVINAVWAWLLIRVGRAEKSPALVADGSHIMTDVVTSIGVFIGLVGAVLTVWRILDPALAVIVALNILWQGWHVIGSSMNGLMDRAVDTQEHMRIRDVCSAATVKVGTELDNNPASYSLADSALCTNGTNMGTHSSVPDYSLVDEPVASLSAHYHTRGALNYVLYAGAAPVALAAHRVQ